MSLLVIKKLNPICKFLHNMQNIDQMHNNQSLYNLFKQKKTLPWAFQTVCNMQIC